MTGTSGRRFLVVVAVLLVLGLAAFLIFRPRPKASEGGEAAASGREGGGAPVAFPVIERAAAFDVNDLAILFPLGPDGLPYPEIKVTAPNGLDPATGKTQGQLWPEHLFRQVMKAAAGAEGTVPSGDTSPGNSIQPTPRRGGDRQLASGGLSFRALRAEPQDHHRRPFPGLPENFPAA